MKLNDLQLSRYRFCAEKTRNDDEDFLWKSLSQNLKWQSRKSAGLDNTSQKSQKKSNARKPKPVILSRLLPR